jgi:hypothetical protein
MSSFNVDGAAPTGGFKMDDIKMSKDRDATYTISKTGNWFLASELGEELAPRGILNIVQNPGNMNTPLFRYLELWRVPSQITALSAQDGGIYRVVCWAFGRVWNGRRWRVCDSLWEEAPSSERGFAEMFEVEGGGWTGARSKLRLPWFGVVLISGLYQSWVLGTTKCLHSQKRQQ